MTKKPNKLYTTFNVKLLGKTNKINQFAGKKLGLLQHKKQFVLLVFPNAVPEYKKKTQVSLRDAKTNKPYNWVFDYVGKVTNIKLLPKTKFYVFQVTDKTNDKIL